MKITKDIKIGQAWVSIGDDNCPIGIGWYRENLQDNVKRIPVAIIPIRKWNKIVEALKKITMEFPEHGLIPEIGKEGHPNQIVDCEAQHIASKALESNRKVSVGMSGVKWQLKD